MTGRPKGVFYSHRALVLHSLELGMVDCFGLREGDIVMPVVPMFHANAWGLPYASVLVGAHQVFPGQHLDPASVAELLESERVTLTAGVPTIWIGLLQLLDKDPKRYDLSAVRTMVIGGSAVPASMLRAFEERHGLKIVQAWGMTETGPMGTISRVPPDASFATDEERFAWRAMQGRPAPFVEIRARSESGLVPWDGVTMGEIEIRGPWITCHYYDNPESKDRFTEDGWFRTGDIATISREGSVQIQDRAKDLIKSGGEWISSVALESALMGHPAVAEAAVIAVAHPRWQERPLAVVVLKDGQSASAEELRRFLTANFQKWWLPDAFEFVSAMPRTSAGKLQKTALRRQYKDYRLPEAVV